MAYGVIRARGTAGNVVTTVPHPGGDLTTHHRGNQEKLAGNLRVTGAQNLQHRGNATKGAGRLTFDGCPACTITGRY